MAVLKIVPGEYSNQDALEKLIGYVFRKALLVGGYGVNPSYAAEQMHIAKQCWNQTKGKQLRHFIVSFDEYEAASICNADDFSLGAYDICKHYYDDGYQSVFGVHYSDHLNNWHIHFVVNNVNFMTGKRLTESISMDIQLKYEIQAGYLPARQVQIYYD